MSDKPLLTLLIFTHCLLQYRYLNEAFTPTAEEIAKAKHIVDEYEKADVQGGLGAIVIDDQMIDAALLRVEWRKLAIARKAGLA